LFPHIRELPLLTSDWSRLQKVFPYRRINVKNERSESTLPMSRRSFFGGAAAAAGGAVLLDSVIPPKVWADENAGTCGSPGLCDFPVPIPHVAAPGLHFFFPGPVEGVDADTGHDPSLIFNFRGFIGQADFVPILGTGIDLSTGATAPYTFHADMRFMSGAFVGTDGHERRGSFLFV
jgi:hypothetical protein